MHETRARTNAGVTCPEPTAVDHPAGEATGHRGRLAVARDAIAAVLGAILGVVPHVLHHVGLIAGAVLVTGAGGNALFLAIGLVLSVPLLCRLYRRFHTWRAPAVAVAVFVAAFSVSAFVIGPAISGESGPADIPSEQVPGTPDDPHHP